MVLFGPVGRHEDLHAEQHEGPLRAKAWFAFYFARSGGRRGCQGTNPLSIPLWVLYLGASNEKAHVGFSHTCSLQVWLPFLLLGDGRIQPRWVLPSPYPHCVLSPGQSLSAPASGPDPDQLHNGQGQCKMEMEGPLMNTY